jgi:rubrerythrin
VDLRTIEEILDFAIEAEVAAAANYRDLADRVHREGLRELLLAIAQQEEAHRDSLERVREGDLSLFAVGLPAVELSAPSAVAALGPNMSAAQLLLAAIDAERQAHQLYSSLAREARDAGIITLLDALAREEARHWRELEVAYDTLIDGGP